MVSNGVESVPLRTDLGWIPGQARNDDIRNDEMNDEIYSMF